MDDNGDDKPNSFDISKIEGVSADDPFASVRNASEIVERMTGGSSAVQQAMRDIGGVGAFAEAARAASSLGIIQDQMDAIRGTSVFTDQITAHQDAMRALAMPDMKEQLSAITGAAGDMDQFRAEQDSFAEAHRIALGGLPEGFIDNLTGASAVSRLMEDMRENHRLMFQHVDMFADMRRTIEAATAFDLNSVLNIPRMDSLYEALGIDRIGQAFATADAASALGINSAFNDDFRSITSLMNEQVSAFGMAQEAASAALGFGLSDKLEVMLARSIAAQEALLQEQRETASDAKAEAAFHRRNATIAIIINILMFLMAIALQIEERISDRDAAVRANTEALQQMQLSFDGMASQLENIQKQQEAASTADQTADAEIAEILRGITATLGEQAESDTSTIANVGTGKENPSAP
ncbi:MAG TPA: hypothetical protein EYP10_10785 [Armatimonadetes bacterium]|nr:hypothetical protein [Armatimonadota bacterium]